MKAAAVTFFTLTTLTVVMYGPNTPYIDFTGQPTGIYNPGYTTVADNKHAAITQMACQTNDM